MRRYRFDREVSVPLTYDASGCARSPLAEANTTVSVSVLHVLPGGHLGRCPKSRLLLALVAGSGRASVPESPPRDLEFGTAVLAEPGERLEIESPAGLTAVVVEGQFEPGGFLRDQEIVVEEYDGRWPIWFGELERHLRPLLSQLAVRLEHVGSTAVPGLAAKPIIDLDVVVPDPDEVEAVVALLEAGGYRWRGDLGVAGREAFAPPEDVALPRHHLYVVVEESRPYLDHVLLRDLLRSDVGARERYAELKRQNVAKAAGDMERYVALKAALVAELLARAREERGIPPVEYWTPDLGEDVVPPL